MTDGAGVLQRDLLADLGQRLADRGDQMRVYIPYGEEWYGYLMRRMAERPANTLFFLRGLATRG